MGSNRNILVAILIAILLIGGYMVLSQPDHRDLGDKVSDAVDKLDDGAGVSKAARELKDRTPGERLKDDIKDATGTH